MRASPECNSGHHGACPGYYLSSHPCGCTCHHPPTPPRGALLYEAAGYGLLAGAVAGAFHIYRAAGT